MDTPEETPLPAERPKKGGMGPILGIIIIIILLALGGLYYFTTGVNSIGENPESAQVENERAALESQGNSSDLSEIEADVEATDFSGLDEASANTESNLEAQ